MSIWKSITFMKSDWFSAYFDVFASNTKIPWFHEKVRSELPRFVFAVKQFPLIHAPNVIKVWRILFYRTMTTHCFIMKRYGLDLIDSWPAFLDAVPRFPQSISVFARTCQTRTAWSPLLAPITPHGPPPPFQKAGVCTPCDTRYSHSSYFWLRCIRSRIWAALIVSSGI